VLPKSVIWAKSNSCHKGSPAAAMLACGHSG